MDKSSNLDTSCSDGSERGDNVIENNLGTLLQNMSLQDAESITEGVKRITMYFDDALKSPNTLRYVLLTTFIKCLEDRELAIRAGVMFGVVHTMKVEEDTVRTIILSAIQKELESNDFSTGDRKRFLNAVFLLSELYLHIRLNDNPISVLGEELIKYFRWLLTGDDDELEVLAIALIVNGSALKKDKPASYRKLLLDIRIALVTRNLSTVSKCWLLLLLDEDNVDYKTLPEELFMCHMTLIGDKGFQKLRRVRPPLAVHQKNDKGNNKHHHSDEHSSSDGYIPSSRQRLSDPGNVSDKLCPAQWCNSCHRYRRNRFQSILESSDTYESSEQLDSSEPWDSPEKPASSAQQNSTDLLPQYRSESQRPVLKTTQRWPLKDNVNHVQKLDWNSQNSQQSEGNANEKPNNRRWSAGSSGSGRGAFEGERRTSAWQHDDRFDRDYSS